MDNKIEMIKSVLVSMRSDSACCSPTDADVKALMHKYDMLFLGSKFNTIYTGELCHALNTKYDIAISLEALNTLVPSLCNDLGMIYEPLNKITDMTNPIPAMYQITLF